MSWMEGERPGQPGRRVRCVRTRYGKPWLERLEDRLAPAGHTLADATLLPFTAFQTAQTAGFLDSANRFDLYQLALNAGDRVSVGVSAQATSGLQSVLRVFDGSGQQLALNDQQGGDPQLTFQVAADGSYFVGISSAGDDAYDPTNASSGQGGGTTGLYALDMRLTPGAPLQEDLTASSFRLLSGGTAAWGDTVQVAFQVENRGGAAADSTAAVQLVLSDSNTFSATQTLSLSSGSISLAGLGQGPGYSSGVLTVTLPDAATAASAGLPASGPMVLGLQISDAAGQDAGAFDKSGVHRGADWEPLTIVTAAAPGATDLSQVDPGLNTQADGTLLISSQQDRYSVSITATAGPGLLSAQVSATSGGVVPGLALLGPNGEMLVQSNTGSIEQHLQTSTAAGSTATTYTLVVFAISGVGGYQLTTSFTPADAPFQPLAVNLAPESVVAADLNGDGLPDLIVTNPGNASAPGNTVSVLLGLGDGTFKSQQTYTVGYEPAAVAVGDVNGDGKPDLVVANAADNTVSVLLGNGDGTFHYLNDDPTQGTFSTGSAPFAVALADLNGDGKLDLVVANYADNTISVLPGGGDGTFGAAQDFGVGSKPKSLAVADLDGDGKPDIAVANYGNATVSVLKNTTPAGAGSFSFQNEPDVNAGKDPRAITVADLDGDGLPDLAVANTLDGTVSVLLGNGDGTFHYRDNDPAQGTFKVGSYPKSVAAADLNGDGKLDLVVANTFDSTIGVLLGNGNGTFQAQRTFAGGSYPKSVAVADFNGDGTLDVAVAATNSNAVVVLQGNGDGTLQPQLAFRTGAQPFAVTVGDVNGDGKPDVVVANAADNTVGVLLGNGDGTFQAQRTFAVGVHPYAVALADVNGDGKLDIVAANYGSGTVSVLLGNGDGTFQDQEILPVGTGPGAVAVADVNGDGKLDIVVASYGSGLVQVLLGKGDGRFQGPQTVGVGSSPVAVAVADLNRDGRPDIVVLNSGDNTVGVLRNTTAKGAQVLSFGATQVVPVGAAPRSLAVADLNGDRKPDLVVANSGDNTVSVLRNTTTAGAATFSFQTQTVTVAGPPNALALGDVNGDGRPDLAVVSTGAGTVSLLLNNGDGTFRASQSQAVSVVPVALAMGDLNGDGKADIVVANQGDNTVSVLLSDSTFQAPKSLSLGSYAPGVMVTADVNGDGLPDLIVANTGTYSYPGDSVSVLLGNGDGTFQAPRTFSVGSYPTSVAVADVNGDGFPDLIVTNTDDNTISVLLGDGHGNFQYRNNDPAQGTFSVPNGPKSVVALDLNGDRKIDLVVANSTSDTVSVLLGNGDGTFRAARTFPVGLYPTSVAVADVNGDGKLDILAGNSGDGTISVLLGDGHGGFHYRNNDPAQGTISLGVGSIFRTLNVADVNGDGKPDLVVSAFLTSGGSSDDVLVLLGDGHGGFHYRNNNPAQGTFPIGFLYSVIVGDVNGDGKPDILFDTPHIGTSVLLGNGDGTFQASGSLLFQGQVGAVADLNGDGTPDLIAFYSDSYPAPFASVLLGQRLTPSTPADGVGARNTPSLADLTGDGIADSVVLDRSGNILFRKGLPGANQFAAPVILNDTVVNATTHTKQVRTAADVTVLRTATGWAVASADVVPDGVLSSASAGSATTIGGSGLVYTVSLYTVAANGTVKGRVAFTTPVQPTRIVAGDLNGDGLDDLVVASSLNDSLVVAFQNPDGTFRVAEVLSTGAAPSDITLKDVNGDGLPDIVVSDQASGDVSVFLNDPANDFNNASFFRAGLGPYGVDASTLNPTATSWQQSVSVAVGDFTGSGLGDVVVVNRGSHSFSVLANDGTGGFVNPQASSITSTSFGAAINDQPGQVVAGDFNHDGKTDLAILMQDSSQIWVYLNNGHGFDAPIENQAGAGATGFSFVTGSSGQPDRFLVGDASGDILILEGDGTGHFAVARGDLTAQPLAVGTTTDGRKFVVVADQGQDQVQLFFQIPGTNQFSAAQTIDTSAQTQALLAPGAVLLQDLNGDHIPDLVVASRLANAVLVYPGLANGTFGAPASYAVGDEPVAVTAAYLSGSNVLDLAVANYGSNDVSILLGSIDPSTGQWTAALGPRLSSGGAGPIAIQAGNFTGQAGIADLRVTNSNGRIATLPGIGSNGQGTGFFRDANPATVNLGAPILQAVIDPSNGNEFLLLPGGVFGPQGQILLGGGVIALSAANGVLALGLQDGGVEVLDEGGSLPELQEGLFAEGANALQVLREANQIDVYATYPGQETPVFYTFAIPVLTELPNSAAVVQASSLEESNFLVVALLLTGSLVEQQGVSVPQGPPGEEAFVLFLSNRTQLPQTRSSLGDEEEHNPGIVRPSGAGVPEPEVQPLGQQPAFRLGVEEALEQLRRRLQPADEFEELLDEALQLLGPLEGLFRWPLVPSENPAPNATAETDAGTPADKQEQEQSAPEQAGEPTFPQQPRAPQDMVFTRVEWLPARVAGPCIPVWREVEVEDEA